MTLESSARKIDQRWFVRQHHHHNILLGENLRPRDHSSRLWQSSFRDNVPSLGDLLDSLLRSVRVVADEGGQSHPPADWYP